MIEEEIEGLFRYAKCSGVRKHKDECSVWRAEIIAIERTARLPEIRDETNRIVQAIHA